MDEHCHFDDCGDCPSRIVCHCLQVTEAEIIEAIRTKDLRTIKDIRRHTAAGDGCTSCHCHIQDYIERFAYALPICSVR